MAAYGERVTELTIPCCDLWFPGTLTPPKLAAYKRAAAQGNIWIRRVVYHKQTGYVTVEYMAGIPHDWMLEQLGREARTVVVGQQMLMDDAPTQ